MGSGAGKHTAEFFRRRDAWRKHPMLSNQFRHATPGLGIALVAFGVYLVAEQVYDRINSPSSSHHVCTFHFLLGFSILSHRFFFLFASNYFLLQISYSFLPWIELRIIFNTAIEKMLLFCEL